MKIVFNILLFALVLISFKPQLSVASPENLNTDFVGSWTANVDGQTIEISSWFLVDFASNKYGGFILFPEQGCKIVFNAHELSPIESYKKAFPFLSEKQLVQSWRMTVRGKKYGIKNSNACNNRFVSAEYNATIGLVHIQGKDAVQIYFKNKGYRAITFRRTEASAQMLTLIDNYKNYVSEQHHFNAPQPIELSIIKDTDNVHSKLEKVNKVSCSVVSKDALSRLTKKVSVGKGQLPVTETIYTEILSDNEVKVTIQKSWDANNELVKRLTLPRLPDIDWQYVQSRRYSVHPDRPVEACYTGWALSKFLDARDAGRFESKKDVISLKEQEFIKKVAGYYLVDNYSVDYIQDDFVHRVKNHAQQETLYKVNDVVRGVFWDNLKETMLIRAHYKHSENLKKGTFHRDYDTDKRYKFSFNQKMSDQYGATIWQADALRPDPEICMFRRTLENDDCEEYAKPLVDRKLYLVSDKKAALDIFNTLEPETVTLSETLRVKTKEEQPCTFCKLPGGAYLDAIYWADTNKIKKIDSEIYAWFNNERDKMKRANSFYGMLLEALWKFSYTSVVFDQYMFKYQHHYKSCLRDNYYGTRAEKILPPTVTYNGLGMEVNRSDGEVIVREYHVNHEFAPLCKELCGSKFDATNFLDQALNKSIDKALLGSKPSEISRGLEKLMTTYSCDSPEIKQFEKNMIKVFYELKKPDQPSGYYERSSPY